jgi:hypothetical protein
VFFDAIHTFRDTMKQNTPTKEEDSHTPSIHLTTPPALHIHHPPSTYPYPCTNSPNPLPSLSGKILKLRAGQGPSSTVLQIHQDVLARNSEYFKRVIKPEWAALREHPDIIDMGPTHTAEEVKCYAHWLYSGTIPTRDFDETDGGKSDPIWIDLVSFCLSVSPCKEWWY